MIELNAAVKVFSVLAHESRLQAFRLLVRAGPDGMSAGNLADRLGLGATAASFHLNRLLQAGLVQRKRDGARLIYTADFALVRQVRDFIDTECCAETAEACGPSCRTRRDHAVIRPPTAAKEV